MANGATGLHRRMRKSLTKAPECRGHNRNAQPTVRPQGCLQPQPTAFLHRSVCTVPTGPHCHFKTANHLQARVPSSCTPHYFSMALSRAYSSFKGGKETPARERHTLKCTHVEQYTLKCTHVEQYTLKCTHVEQYTLKCTLFEFHITEIRATPSVESVRAPTCLITGGCFLFFQFTVQESKSDRTKKVLTSL